MAGIHKHSASGEPKAGAPHHRLHAATDHQAEAVDAYRCATHSISTSVLRGSSFTATQVRPYRGTPSALQYDRSEGYVRRLYRLWVLKECIVDPVHGCEILHCREVDVCLDHWKGDALSDQSYTKPSIRYHSSGCCHQLQVRQRGYVKLEPG